MKKLYIEPQAAIATYADMIMVIKPGTQKRREYGDDMPVDAHERNGFNPEDGVEPTPSDSIPSTLW